MRILITGASGCIGQYISEALIQETDHELFLLVRNPARLQIEPRQRSGVNVIQGDLMDLTSLEPLLPTSMLQSWRQLLGEERTSLLSTANKLALSSGSSIPNAASGSFIFQRQVSSIIRWNRCRKQVP